jgi:hypothetical protein
MRKGFTIIEVSIAGLLIVALGVGLVTLQHFMTQGQLTAISSFLSVDQSNYAVSTIIREIRTARKGDNGTFPLELADSQEIIFYSDIDSDGKTERVRYYVDGTRLMKSVIKPTGNPLSYPENQAKTKVITEYLRNGSLPTFYYYNQDWPQDTTNNPLPTPANLNQVRLVQVFLKINSRENEPNKDYVLESFATIRMLKSN